MGQLEVDYVPSDSPVTKRKIDQLTAVEMELCDE